MQNMNVKRGPAKTTNARAGAVHEKRLERASEEIIYSRAAYGLRLKIRQGTL